MNELEALLGYILGLLLVARNLLDTLAGNLPAGVDYYVGVRG